MLRLVETDFKLQKKKEKNKLFETDLNSPSPVWRLITSQRLVHMHFFFRTFLSKHTSRSNIKSKIGENLRGIFLNDKFQHFSINS